MALLSPPKFEKKKKSRHVVYTCKMSAFGFTASLGDTGRSYLKSKNKKTTVKKIYTYILTVKI